MRIREGGSRPPTDREMRGRMLHRRRAEGFVGERLSAFEDGGCRTDVGRLT